MHCLTKNLPRRFIQLEGVMDHGSLPLAIAPSAFPRGELVCSACRAGGCGFVIVDSVLGSGAAAPGRYPRCSVRDWQAARTRPAPTLLQRGLSGYAASPARVCSAPALGAEVWSSAAGSRTLPSPGTFPAVQRSTEKTRIGAGEMLGTKGEQFTAQRKTACCNCSSCWNRRMGSRDWDTSVSSCCFCSGNTPDCRRRWSGVLAES